MFLDLKVDKNMTEDEAMLKEKWLNLQDLSHKLMKKKN